MPSPADNRIPWFERRVITVIAVLLALIVAAYAWFGISESRKDSLQLLVIQGTTFTEALAQSAKNAIEAESFFDYLVHLRYEEIFVELSQMEIDETTPARLNQAAVIHDLKAVYLCGVDGEMLASGTVPTWTALLPEFVLTEVQALGENPETNYVLLLEPGSSEQPPLHYYLQIANTMDRIVVLVVDAGYYVEALRQTQIGYLVQNMARERAVEYIIYQSTEGIIFASRRTGQLLAIESDPFLQEALDSDTIMHRLYEFQGEEVLELVRPFATDEYEFGLFRVGLSLKRYYDISSRFDVQMAALSVALFGLLLVGLLYVQSRQKRRELRQQYTDIKSLTDIVFHQMRTGVAVLDESGRVTLANQAFEKIVGVRSTLGKAWEDVVRDEQLRIEQLRKWKESAEEAELTIRVGGEERTLVLAVSGFEAAARDPGGLVLVVYDVTRLREFERREVRRARLSELGNLAAGVAHEIRNPLNTISIAAQRLAAEFTPTAQKEEFISFTQQIREETRRLNEIITRFLALAREDQKSRRTVELSALLSEAAGFLKLEAEQIGIALETAIESELALQADRDAFKQILTNLFNNAKEALGRMGGRILISAKKDGGVISLVFEDDGPGIPEELREKVFTPYFTTKEAGTGLGLPTVHRIVSDMGGEIRVEQSELGGARFVMTFDASG